MQETYAPTQWRRLDSSELELVSGGRWDVFQSWDDLLLQNYSIAEQFEDGRIGAWLLEDWEIYGPGAGGYTSSGPYGNWQADIQAWLQNGSMLANEVINWSAATLQQKNMSGVGKEIVSEFSGLNIVEYNNNYYFNGRLVHMPGSVTQLDGDTIQVVAATTHSDYSTTYRFTMIDPVTNQQFDFSHNVSWIDGLRNQADVENIMFWPYVEFTQADLDAQATARSLISEVVGLLGGLSPTGYFDVQGWGRITVAELVDRLRRADFEIRPDGALGSQSGVGQTVWNLGDPILRVEQTAFRNYMSNPTNALYYVLHELSHATRAGRDATNLYGNGNALEVMTNDVAAFIAAQIQRPFPSGFVPNPPPGYGNTQISYNPNPSSS